MRDIRSQAIEFHDKGFMFVTMKLQAECKTCGSGLARESDLTFNMDVG
jgi:hypothetical protein